MRIIAQMFQTLIAVTRIGAYRQNTWPMTTVGDNVSSE